MEIEFPLKTCRKYESWWSDIKISSVYSPFPGVFFGRGASKRHILFLFENPPNLTKILLVFKWQISSFLIYTGTRCIFQTPWKGSYSAQTGPLSTLQLEGTPVCNESYFTDKFIFRKAPQPELPSALCSWKYWHQSGGIVGQGTGPWRTAVREGR